MATLSRKIIDVKLPSFGDTDPVTVKIFDKIVAGDYDEMPEFDRPREAMYWIYAKIIQAWDLKTETGEPLPITIDHIRMLPIEDLSAIRSATGMDKQFDTAKKNS